MSNKDLYINKKTFDVVEYPVGHQRTKCVKIPEEAEICYYFDGSDPEGVEDLVFYTKDLEATWSDYHWSDNTRCTSPTFQEIKDYVREYGQIVWKRDVAVKSVDDAVRTVS